MKLLSALAFVASMASAASASDTNGYKNARVVPDVLPEDSIAAKLRDHVGTFRLLRKASGDGKNRQYGEASISADDFRRILMMKFLSALAFVASMACAASAVDTNGYENARVVHGVLPEDSVAKLHDHVGTFRFLRKSGDDGKHRQNGEVSVSADDLRRLLLSIGDKREVREGMTLWSTLVTGDTDPHTDTKVGGDKRFEEDEDVMFVFLNDNEAAYFQVGEDKIPVKAGTVVSFKGNSVVHNTVVPSGEVRLLGPISSRDLEGVVDISACRYNSNVVCIGSQEHYGCCLELFAPTVGCIRRVERGNGEFTCMCTLQSDWDALETVLLRDPSKKVPKAVDFVSQSPISNFCDNANELFIV